MTAQLHDRRQDILLGRVGSNDEAGRLQFIQQFPKLDDHPAIRAGCMNLEK